MYQICLTLKGLGSGLGLVFLVSFRFCLSGVLCSAHFSGRTGCYLVLFSALPIEMAYTTDDE